MFGQPDPSKTEKATDKRRKKAREDGNVPKGQELGKALVLIAGLIGLHVWIGAMSGEIKVIFAWFLGTAPVSQVNPTKVYNLFLDVAVRIAFITMPVMLFVGLVAFLAQRLQVGGLWTTKVFKPKFDKVFNVVAGLKKFIINPQMFINLGKNILTAIAIGIAPYIVLSEEIHKVGPLFYTNAEGVAVYLLTTGSRMVVYALVPMLIIAIADTVYTRWNYEEQLKMTKDEVKDERKQAEGDPRVKAEQRKKMLQVHGASHDAGRAQGRRGRHQPDPRGHRPAIRPALRPGPAGAGQGPGQRGRKDQGDRPRKRGAHPREQAPGTGLV